MHMGRSHTEEEAVRAVSFEPESHVPSVLGVDDFASTCQFVSLKHLSPTTSEFVTLYIV